MVELLLNLHYKIAVCSEEYDYHVLTCEVQIRIVTITVKFKSAAEIGEINLFRADVYSKKGG